MKNTQNLVISKKMIHLCMRLRCYGYNSRFGKDSYGSVHRGEEVKSLFSDDWGNHLETEYGNQFITEYGNQFATEYGNQLGSDLLLTKISVINDKNMQCLSFITDKIVTFVSD